MDSYDAHAVDKRTTVRITCQTPLVYKICKEETISALMAGYTQDVSPGGIRCTVTEKIPIGCILWLKLDKDALMSCEEIEKNAVILQQGILGKVVWVNENPDYSQEIGLRFVTREEKDTIKLNYNI